MDSNALTFEQLMELHQRVENHCDLQAARVLMDATSTHMNAFALRPPVWHHNRVAFAIGHHLNVEMMQELLALHKKHKQAGKEVPPLHLTRQALIRGTLSRPQDPTLFFEALCEERFHTLSAHPAMDVIKMGCYNDHTFAMEWALEHLQPLLLSLSQKRSCHMNWIQSGKLVYGIIPKKMCMEWRMCCLM